jgi:hypothetical protein
MFNLFPKFNTTSSSDNVTWSSTTHTAFDKDGNPIYIHELISENAELKNGNKNWMSLYQDVVDKNNELLKEIKNLRHLKQENLNLIDRVNEIDSDVIRDLNDEILVLKNANAVLKSKVRDWEDKYAKSFSCRDMDKLQKEIDEQCDKEKSWEEAASDLALRVAKLEEQLKYTQKIICPE